MESGSNHSLSAESPPSPLHTDIDLPTPSPKDLLIASYDVLIRIFKLFIPTAATTGAPENQLARVGRKQLLNLALTCKSFVDPALECLWAHLESLDPLFELHPGLEIVDGSYFFTGDLNAQGSSRYHKYACKVRTVSFREPTSPRTNRIAFAGYTWLGQQLQGAPLLPGLRSIHFADCPANSLHLGLLPLMLSPSVERVEFSNSFLSTPAFHTYALRLVCKGLPSLTELVLCDAGPSKQVSQDMWGVLGGMSTRLQSLTLRFPNSFVLGNTTLRTLSRELSNLTSLFLDVHTESHGQSNVAGKKYKGLLTSTLRTVHLVHRSGTKLCACYPSFLLQKATSITFSLTGNVDDENAFSNSLDTLSSVKSLRRVEIEGPNQSYIKVGSIIPFLRRLQLEELHLQKVWGFKQDENEKAAHHILQGLVDEASNIGRLRFLSLPIWRGVTRTYNPYTGYTQVPPHYHSVSCLLSVAQHAKALQHMSLSIDSNAAGPNKETLASMIQNWSRSDIPSKLRYLEIAEMRDPGSFTPLQCRDIARLLDLIFPNLMSVTMIKDNQLPTRWEEHWQLIEEYRQMLKSLRLYRENRW